MQVTSHIRALQDDLAAVAALGDAATAEAGRRLSLALEATIRLRIVELLAEAAVELDAQLQHGRVDVRLAGGEPSFVFTEDAPQPAADAPSGEDALSARITLRLPESLKADVEAAAARASLSANAWIVRALARAVQERSSRGAAGGRRMSGYGRS